jgi:hypothetical protein
MQGVCGRVKTIVFLANHLKIQDKLDIKYKMHYTNVKISTFIREKTMKRKSEDRVSKEYEVYTELKSSASSGNVESKFELFSLCAKQAKNKDFAPLPDVLTTLSELIEKEKDIENLSFSLLKNNFNTYVKAQSDGDLSQVVARMRNVEDSLRDAINMRDETNANNILAQVGSLCKNSGNKAWGASISKQKTEIGTRSQHQTIPEQIRQCNKRNAAKGMCRQ